ncbi:helix-turn-helix domain-containing protein [Brucella pituitosa]|uniref:helix-turn-helix domain-containing protein n=1 Tax=Brucella pituitosa TaxID=571256 RepID=UPI0013747B94|nr:helix-turn-helix transcriptional regulator [Brucella pituitosa]
MGQRLFEPDTLNLHPVILDFARNLRGARMKLKLSQKELADASGLTQAALSRYERGVILPKLPSMIALADVLGIPLWLLLKPERLDSLSE